MNKIVILDDDINAAQELKARLISMMRTAEIDCYSSVSEFEENASAYNIAIIDILLGKDNGIDIASRISENEPKPLIIFISNEKDFFQDVYRAEHVYFLTKPVSDNELREAIEICHERIKNKFISLKYNKGKITLELNHIAYLEGSLKKTIIHYSDGDSQTFNQPLRDIEKLLANSDFIRTHQSYIVNLRHMRYAEKKKLFIGGDEIPISRRYSKEVADSVTVYLSDGLIG